MAENSNQVSMRQICCHRRMLNLNLETIKLHHSESRIPPSRAQHQEILCSPIYHRFCGLRSMYSVVFESLGDGIGFFFNLSPR